MDAEQVHDPAHAGSKLKGFYWLMLAGLIALLLAGGVRPLAHAVPWRWEKKLAALTLMEVKGQQCKHVAGEAALKKLVARIYPLAEEDGTFSIDVHLVKKREVNAFAAPGGQVVLYSGLIAKAQSAEEVAGVLAHEIAHVRHRHVMQGMITYLFTASGMAMVFGDVRYADVTRYFLGLQFSRRQEGQADAAAFERLAKAEVDVQPVVRFFQRMEAGGGLVPQMLSDHPATAERVALAEGYQGVKVRPILTAEEWGALRAACGK